MATVKVPGETITGGDASETKQDAQITLLAGGLPAALGAGGGLKVDGSGTALPVSGTVTANLGVTDNAVLDSLVAALPAALSAGGNLKVSIEEGAAAGGTSTADDADFVAGTTAGTSVQGVYESSPTTVTDGHLGTVGITANRVLKVIPSTAAGVPVTPVADPADDSAFTPGTTTVSVIAGFADETAPDSVDEGDLGAIRMTLDRRMRTCADGDVAHNAADAGNPVKIGGKGSAAAPTAADGDDRVNASFDLQGRLRVLQDAGLTIFRSLDLDESEEEVKATAGKVAWIQFSNCHATDARYLKFYNATAANVTVGTTTPVLTVRLRGATDGWVPIPDGGLIFDTAITVAATTALADADTGAPGANEVVVNLGYK